MKSIYYRDSDGVLLVDREDDQDKAERLADTDPGTPCGCDTTIDELGYEHGTHKPDCDYNYYPDLD